MPAPRPFHWPALRSGAPLDSRAEPLASAALAWLVAAGFMAALTWVCLVRGPWYDEFYTWYVTRPDRGFGESLRGSWLADNHPPLYYALTWPLRQLGGTIETQRLASLGVAAAALCGAWTLLRGRPRLWLLGAAFLLLLVGHEAALRAGSELRSYFLSYAACAVLVLALVTGWLEQGLPRGTQRIVLWAAMGIAFNTHVATSLIAGALVLPFLLAAWLRGNRPLAWTLTLPALVAGSVLLAISALQIPQWHRQTAQFWIPAGFDAARWSFEYALRRTLVSNWALTLAGTAGGVMLLIGAVRARRLDSRTEAWLLLAAGAMLAGTILLGLHMLRPIVIERYLIGLVPAFAMLLALGFARLRDWLPPRVAVLLLVLAALMAGFSIADSAARAAARQSWSGTAALIARVQHACPATAVHIDPDHWNAWTMSFPPADNRPAFFAAYALMAQRGGFTLEPLTSRRMPADCPTLFWAEHDTLRSFDPARITAHLRAQGFVVEGGWQYRIDHGWVASNRPLDSALTAN